jgi:hemerythrin
MVELTPSFLLEYEALDQDHQRLADIVNQIVKAIDDGEAEKCESLVGDFVKSAKSHFAKEEALLVRIGYPNVKKHQAHHKSLYIKMDHMIEFAKMAGENQMARDSLRKELVFFLMDDIITVDMDFKNFIAERTQPGKA